MKRIPTNELIPGMVTAEDIYNYNNQMVFPRGFVLTDRAIARLAFYAIDSIRVDDKIVTVPKNPTLEVEAKAIPSHREQVLSDPAFLHFKSEFEDNVDDFKDRMNHVVKRNTSLDVSKILDNAFHLVDMGKQSYGIFDLLGNMREYDDETYAHSLNVALLCNVLAGWLRLKEEEVEMATLSGMFHDVGKIQIPDAILKKEGPLTEIEHRIIETHTMESYKILRDLPLHDHVKNAALMHHERNDGRGYPFNVSIQRTDPYARMVSVADVYDAMTSLRCYRPGMSPFKTVSIMENDGITKYDPVFLNTFLERAATSYINNRVLLTNGEKGEVVYIPHDNPSKPTVKVGDKYVDLSKEKDIDIKNII